VPRPLLVEASARSAAGDERGALRTLERAVLRFPGEPQTWLRLANYQFSRLDRPGAAAETLRGFLYLDPKSSVGRQLFLDARAAQRKKDEIRAQEELLRKQRKARRRGKRS
jgi:hypothetical protein